MDKVTLIDKIYNRVIELGESEPDFVYGKQDEYDRTNRACHYLSADGNGNGRGCIVGQAMQDVVPTDEFNLIEMDKDAEEYIIHVLSLDQEEYDEARNIIVDLLMIQSRQDLGESWGTAIRGYKKVKID